MNDQSNETHITHSGDMVGEGQKYLLSDGTILTSQKRLVIASHGQVVITMKDWYTGDTFEVIGFKVTQAIKKDADGNIKRTVVFVSDDVLQNAFIRTTPIGMD